MLNKVMLIGRLGQDPEVRYTQQGTPIANFSVATDESYTDRDGARQERTEWHRIVVFERQAENCANYLGKGSLVYIEGKLQTRKWQDQQGQDRYTTEIRAQRVQFLDRKGDASQASYEDRGQQGSQKKQGFGQHGAPRPAQQARAEAPHAEQPPAYPSESPDMDGLPF